MKRLIVKGFLLYFTAFFIILNILSIDMEGAGFIVFAFITSTILVSICKMEITEEEFYILSLQKWVDEWFKKVKHD